ncbi:MAG: hypothetical protein FWC41_00780 [Firmicutes bacterium]|nr:hypothetical protein [Bacillota bacterium]
MEKGDINHSFIPPWISSTSKTFVLPFVSIFATKSGATPYIQSYNGLRDNRTDNYISILKNFDSIVNFCEKSKIKNKTHYLYFYNLPLHFQTIILELLYNNFSQVLPESGHLEYENPHIISNFIIDNKKIFKIFGKNISSMVSCDIVYKGHTFKLKDLYKIVPVELDFFYDACKIPYQEEPTKIDVDSKKDIFLLFEYSKNLLKVLIKCFERFFKIFEELGGGGKYTIASIAQSTFINHIGGTKEFNKLFPNLTGSESALLSDCCYNGGVNNIYKPTQIYKNIKQFDIKSSYPFAMAQHMPYGKPKKINYIKNYRTRYCEYLLKIKFKIKDNFKPCIRISSTKKISEHFNLLSDNSPWFDSEHFPIEYNGYIALNSNDIKILNKYYDWTYELILAYEYKTKKIFESFITKIYNKKQFYSMSEFSDLLLVLIYKLILNSIYGKFAQNLTGLNTFYFKSHNDVIFEKKDFSIYCKDNKQGYKPVSNATVSNGRLRMVQLINQNINNIIYCDTDSIYCIDKINTIGFSIGSKIGELSTDYANIEQGIFLNKKMYLIQDVDKLKLTCSGLNQKYIYNYEELKKNNKLIKENIDFNNFINGYKIYTIDNNIIDGGVSKHLVTFTFGDLENKRGYTL